MDFIPILRNFQLICRTQQSSLWGRQGKKLHLESFLQTQTTSETAGKRKINIYFSEFETRHVEYYSNRTTYNSCFLLGENERRNCSCCKLVDERILKMSIKRLMKRDCVRSFTQKYNEFPITKVEIRNFDWFFRLALILYLASFFLFVLQSPEQRTSLYCTCYLI